jgi:ATP-binding cassette subfamily C (CFTR/MRP) protein 1
MISFHLLPNKKSLILSPNARQESTIGEITNLVSVNAQSLLDIMPYVNIVWSGPFQIIVGTIMLWSYLGVASLVGLIVMVVLIPLNVHRTSLKLSEQKKLLVFQDSRIKMMNEILVGIRIIKFLGWELCFRKLIEEIREVEMRYLNKIGFITCLSSFFWTCTPFLVSVASFGAYSLINDTSKLDPMIVFVSVCLFEIIKFPLNVFPFVISTIMQVS